MSADFTPDAELSSRLPLPLSQLYRRAFNAKTPLERHNAAYYLWEASLKLLGSAAIVSYAAHPEHAPEHIERLKHLARPSLGHWWEFVRLLVPILAENDEGFRSARDLVLGKQRDDMPRAAGLDVALRETLDGNANARVTVRLSELFDRMVRYRNREFGHGASGQGDPAFYDRMGRTMLLGTSEILAKLDPLAGRHLVQVADVRRQSSGRWLIERYELIGDAAKRLESLERSQDEAATLPNPGRLYLYPKNELDPAKLYSLHPIVLFDADALETAFLNARRGKTRAEYLCYHTGRVSERTDLDVERRGLISQILGVGVDESATNQWAASSQAEEPTEAPPINPTHRRMGEFELLSELGRGGMGVVYRAWQPSLGRQVAVKSLLRSGDAKADARFYREIHALGRVEHPNLIKVFTSGSESDQWFYAMELVEGATLAAVCGQLTGSGAEVSKVNLSTWQSSLGSTCRATREAEKPLIEPRLSASKAEEPTAPPEVLAAGGRDYIRHVVNLVRQVAEAAHALHEAGVIHRDIKPENILVTPDGKQAVLMDLGLAQLADESEGRLTRARQFVGTLRYASPEQVLSVPLDRRSDVYSLGATLWELLTLRPLFGATDQTPTPELMLKIQSADPERPGRINPGVPEDLEAITLKCLEKARARRYASAVELAADLDRWLEGKAVHAQPPTLRYMIGKYVRRHRLPIAAARALTFAIIASVVAVGVAKSASERRRGNFDHLDTSGGFGLATHGLTDQTWSTPHGCYPSQTLSERSDRGSVASSGAFVASADLCRRTSKNEPS